MLYLINDINDQLIDSMLGTNNARNSILFKSIIYIYLSRGTYAIFII